MTSEQIQKISIEPYYNTMYREYGLQYCVDNGFFFNSNSQEIDWNVHVQKIPCTPLMFLEKQNPNFKRRKQCVILSTGAHCPMHVGHVEMMEVAKASLQQQGYHVLGGYLSPGHDEYIKDKTKDEYMPIHDRLDYANNLIKDKEWLAIDPWEGLFAPGAVNYTSVVYRLQQYLKYWLREEEITIFYVCGADNARFYRVFKNTDIKMCVVTRPNYDLDYIAAELIDHDITIITANNDLSSTKVRKEKFYQDYLKKRHTPKQLYFRMNWNYRQSKLLWIMRKYFVNVFPQDILAQQELCRESVNKNNTILNLDANIDLGIKLHISRLYDNFGQKKLGYTHRPDSPSINQQILEIKNEINSDVLLFDDDIHTGGTMNFVQQVLHNFNINVSGRFSLVTSNNDSYTEILDAKDFMLGESNGGLVTKINNKLVRVPYIYPFVCPKTRASIHDPFEFSELVWLANYNHYIKTDLTLNDVEELNYFCDLGFSSDTKISDICAYYHKFLYDANHI